MCRLFACAGNRLPSLRSEERRGPRFLKQAPHSNTKQALLTVTQELVGLSAREYTHTHLGKINGRKPGLQQLVSPPADCDETRVPVTVLLPFLHFYDVLFMGRSYGGG
jgi:hypothetical protein